MQVEVKIEKAEDSSACGIRLSTPTVRRWFGRSGRVPVVATINGCTYRSSLSPMGGCHILPVNARVRAEARVKAGDKVRLELKFDSAPRTIEAPDDLNQALAAAGMRDMFDSMSFTHRKEWINAVLDAKRPQTRAKRVNDCVRAMGARTGR